MAKENKKIRMNNLKVKSLQADYNNRMANLMKIKSEKLFLLAVSDANSVLIEINKLRIKSENIRNGRPENGYQDHLENITILE